MKPFKLLSIVICFVGAVGAYAYMSSTAKVVDPEPSNSTSNKWKEKTISLCQVGKCSVKGVREIDRESRNGETPRTESEPSTDKTTNSQDGAVKRPQSESHPSTEKLSHDEALRRVLESVKNLEYPNAKYTNLLLRKPGKPGVLSEYEVLQRIENGIANAHQSGDDFNVLKCNLRDCKTLYQVYMTLKEMGYIIK